MIDKIRIWAKSLKAEIAALAGAVRDSRTPWHAKAVGFVIVAYALSPIDLIPDFIPIIGFLDDAILLPLGIWLVLRLIPRDVMAEHRASVAAGQRLPPNRIAAAVIIGLWIAGLIFAAHWLSRAYF